MECSFCNRILSNNSYKVYSKILDKNVEYLICKFCGSLQQFPLPDLKNIQNYYESYQEIKGKMNPGYLDNNQLKSLFEERDKTLKEIKFRNEWFKGTNNVELGCANGHFLSYMKSKGATIITGLDISLPLLEKIDLQGVNLINGDLSKIDEKSVDNLFLFNVLEHNLNIEILLKQISVVSKKNGRIVIEVPIAGLISKLFKNKWRFLMVDEHLHIPSYRGLKRLLSKYGFKLKGKTRFGSGFTSGMIQNNIKNKFDFIAKKLFIGDRGTFLFIKESDESF